MAASTINHLGAINFSRFQYGLESGSGPGDRRLKSSLPDHLSSIGYTPSESRKIPAVGKNATVLTSLIFHMLFFKVHQGEFPFGNPTESAASAHTHRYRNSLLQISAAFIIQQRKYERSRANKVLKTTLIPLMKLREVNYKPTELLKKLRQLIKRDSALIGDVVQRTVILKRDGKTLEHSITRIDILRKEEEAIETRTWPEPEQDYGQILFTRDRISLPRLLSRLKQLSSSKFGIKRKQFIFSQVPHCQHDFHPRNREYHSWPGILFDIGVGSGTSYLTSETLLHPDLPTYDSEFAATADFLSLPNFSANDGRIGHIVLFFPSYNARIEKLDLESENLRVEVKTSIPVDKLVLELDWSNEHKKDRQRILLNSNVENVSLKFLPTILNIWLKSRDGDVFDYHKDNSYWSWSVGVMGVLPRVQPGMPWSSSATVLPQGFTPLEDVETFEISPVEAVAGGEPSLEHRFLTAGSQHDAYKEIRNIVKQAGTDIMIVDPYVDDSLWTLLTNVPATCKICVLTQTMKADFKLEAKKFTAQHKISIEVRTTTTYHDRFIIVDNKRCFHLGASIKDAGNKTFVMSEMTRPAIVRAALDDISREWSDACLVLL